MVDKRNWIKKLKYYPMPDETYKHLESKGCKLVSAQKIVGKVNMHGRPKDRILYFLMCLTHGADVCRCGWEFTNHPISQKEPHFSPAEMMELNIKKRRKPKQKCIKKVTYSR